jgi:prepilin-type processing-associated H-X9-DG protein
MIGEMSWYNAGYYRVWTRGTWSGDTLNRDTTCCRNVDQTSPINLVPYDSNNADNANNVSFGSDHTGKGANFSMADGSVRWISASIAMPTYLSLASYNGGEEVPPF